MKDKNSFILYKSFYPPVSFLTLEQKGKLFDAIFRYQIEGFTDVDDDIKMPFLFFVNQFKVDNAKYEELCAKRREAGGRGGAPKGNQNALKNNQNNQMVEKQPKQAKQANGLKTTKTSLNDNDNVNDNDIIINNPKGYEKFNFDFVEEEFKDIFFNWLEYKRVRGEKYKVQNSIESAYRKLKELSSNDPERAALIVEQSFANNWAGLFAIKDTQYGNNGNSNEGNARAVGEKVLSDIFAEIEERRRIEGTTDGLRSE